MGASLSGQQKSATESRFNMWRAIVAMAHADHVVTEEEKDYLRGFFRKGGFSAEQVATLGNDLDARGDVGEIFARVTDPQDRAEFVYFARLLCWSDGEFAQQEEAILKQVSQSVLSRLDLERLMESVDAEVKAETQRHAAEMKAANRKEPKGLVWLISSLIDRFGG